MRAITLMAGTACCLMLASVAWAQPPQEGPAFGWEETVVRIREVPLEHRDSLKAETGFDLAVGFAYRRAYLFHPDFSFWHWRGRPVLYFGGNLFEPSEQQWNQLLGPEEFAALPVPAAYRLPPGAIVTLLAAVCLALVVYLFPTDQGRVKTLLKDLKYVQAVTMYQEAVPDEQQATAEQRNQAIGQATARLINDHAVEPTQADKSLRLILNELNRAQTGQFRQLAAVHEQAGNWLEAAELYAQAAELREPWDAKDHAFLLKCVARCEKRLS